MQKSTLEAIVKSFKIASKDETRYHLMGVLVTPNEVVATDGHRMSVIPHGDKDTFKVDHWVSREQLPILKLILKAQKYLDTVDTNSTDALTNIYSLGKEICCTIKTCASAEIKYPNWKSLVPDTKDYIDIGFNTEYLAELHDALKDNEFKSPIVRFRMQVKRDDKGNLIGLSHLSPVRVEHGPSNYGILMPGRF